MKFNCTVRKLDMDAFHEHLRTYHENQLRRLKDVKGSSAVEEASREFESLKLTPDHIRDACWTELRRVTRLTYDTLPAEQTGPRLGGLGWSVAHVKAHMDRFFEKLLQDHQAAVKAVLRSA